MQELEYLGLTDERKEQLLELSRRITTKIFIDYFNPFPFDKNPSIKRREIGFIQHNVSEALREYALERPIKLLGNMKKVKL